MEEYYKVYANRNRVREKIKHLRNDKTKWQEYKNLLQEEKQLSDELKRRKNEKKEVRNQPIVIIK